MVGGRTRTLVRHKEKHCKTTGPTYIIDITFDTTNLTSKFEGGLPLGLADYEMK